MWGTSVSFSLGHRPIAPCFLSTFVLGGGGCSDWTILCIYSVRGLCIARDWPQTVVRGCIATSRCRRRRRLRWQGGVMQSGVYS